LAANYPAWRDPAEAVANYMLTYEFLFYVIPDLIRNLIFC